MAAVSPSNVMCSAPTLPLDRITELLNSFFNLDVKKSDLIPGNPEKLIDIYVLVLERCGYDTGSLAQPSFKCLPECADEMGTSIFISNLYSTLDSFLKRILYRDFSIADLLIPNVRRTQVALSHILNFLIYCDSREYNTERCKAAYQHWWSQKAKLEKNVPLAQRKRTDLAAELTELQQCNHLLNEENEELLAEFAELMTKKEQVLKQSQELSSTNEKLMQVKQKHEEQINELRGQLSKLDEKVLDSPLNVQDKVDTKKAALAKLKADLFQTKQELSVRQEQKKHCADFKEQMLVVHKLIHAILEILSKADKLNNELKTAEHRKQAIRDNILELEDIHKTYLSDLSLLQEQRTSIDVQHRSKIATLKTSLKEAKSNKKTIHRNVQKAEVVLRHHQQDCENLSSQLQKIEGELGNLDEMSQLHLLTLSKLDQFHNRLNSSVKATERMVKDLVSAFDFKPE